MSDHEYQATPKTYTDGDAVNPLTDVGGRTEVNVNVGGVAPQLDDTDKVAVSMYGEASAPGDTTLKVLVNQTDAVGVGSDGLMVTSFGYLYNGSTLDRQRNNVEATALASAARTATTQSPTITNYNGKGVAVFLDVTVNPGGSETLALAVNALDPITGTGTQLATASAHAFGGSTGSQSLIVYPGVSDTPGGSGSASSDLILPRSLLIKVVHSASGSWTYSVGYCLIN